MALPDLIPMRTAVVLFTRDLRVRDHPALTAATQSADRVVPLFVFDDALLTGPFASPNRVAYLRGALVDLNDSLRRRGGRLFVRRGDVVSETMRVAEELEAESVHVSEDVSSYAQARLRRLRVAGADAGIEVVAHPGVTVVPPGALRTTAGAHFRVFTPYWRRWRDAPLRPVLRAPRIAVPSRLATGRIPARSRLTGGSPSPNLRPGGEGPARRAFASWLRTGIDGYAERHDDLALDATSHLSAALHFGCLSPLEVTARARDARGEGAAAFVRQLCWRDFHHQVLAAWPETARHDLHPGRREWVDDPDALAAWAAGRTGIPIVDAGMRQLRHEGWMHNRARLVVGDFLTKHLGIDWREGAAHFFALLVDGDVANNIGNWQWVAGTGTDTRPNRVLNPLRQARRFDPDGTYVRRWVDELAGVDGPSVHTPWRLAAEVRRGLDYPDPLVDLDEDGTRARGGSGKKPLVRST